MKDIRVVELFAGVGGFRLGLEKASKKFKTVWANQWEPSRKVQWAFDCYQQNFGNSDKHSNKDIATVVNEVPEHDLLVAGFPCQDYSVARSGAQGIEGKKGVLWWSILEIIKLRHPLFILLENVDRLIKSPVKQRGRDFGIMLRALDDEGYNVEWRVINAADYGHAQKRKRVFIFASSKELTNDLYKGSNQFTILSRIGFFAQQFPIKPVEKPGDNTCIPIVNGYKDLVEVSDNFSTKFLNSGTMINGQVLSLETKSVQKNPVKLGDILLKEEVDEKYFINGNSERFKQFKKAKKIVRIDREGEIYLYSEGNMSFPDSLALPARTLLTSEGSLNRSTHIVEDYVTKRLRILTPLECERINGFDDGWTDIGMPDSARYFCMGNALVVPLITEMGQQFLKIWRNLK